MLYTWEWFLPTFWIQMKVPRDQHPPDTVIYYVTGYADCDTIYDTITVNAYTV